MTRLEVPDTVMAWLRKGEHGQSSLAIVEHLWGIPYDRIMDNGPDHPWDPADLRRCLLLLDRSPETRALFGGMRSASETWDRLVTAWETLETTLRQEIGSDLPDYGWSAPKTYAAMKQIIDRRSPLRNEQRGEM